MRSVVVVLPASMWAIIPIFRVRSNDISRGMIFSLVFPSVARTKNREPRTRHQTRFSIRPQGIRFFVLWLEFAVVRECAVGFGHTLDILFALDSAAGVVEGIHQLAGQAFVHGLPGSAARRDQQPAHRQRHAPITLDFDRNLVGGTAGALGL